MIGDEDRGDAVTAARRLVEERFPDARAAFLGGSVVLGGATATSDLDVTVVRAEGAAYRESLTYAGWPVELFVHTPASVRHYVGKDLERRRPTMARLVSAAVVLLDRDGSGAALAAECAAAVAAGPGPLAAAERDALRYGLTDLLDDLAGGGDPPARTAVAVHTWQAAGELLLAAEGRWSGTGKWLVRELAAYDAEAGSAYASRLDAGLRAALDGDPGPLTQVADEVLARCGGRLWVGYRAGGETAD
ncbi:nucleotidyltransferase domain-containing protein [Nocardioides koreensis]|uniref:Nucleotidyltransferase domain-containing protein n=1 Tax=Nocardioides koreensis TaxID=433651 RepID=A0ABN2ZAG5_9ACTN